MIKFLIFAAISMATVVSFAQKIDCYGTWSSNGESFYLSTDPVAPYNQFVRQTCFSATSWPVGGLDADFYLIDGVDAYRDSQKACKISGSLSPLKLVSWYDDDYHTEYHFGFCERDEQCEASRVLRLAKKKTEAIFFNLHGDGQHRASASLNCHISP